MEPSGIYHVYNHANGFEKLFREDDDFKMFIDKYRKQTYKYLDTLAFCLMTNHYHLLVHVKDQDYFDKFFANKNPKKLSSKSLSNTFNGYAQCYNRKYSRMGSLFMQNMNAKVIESEVHFCKIVHYIHANPVHHGFASKMEDWKYSSYSIYLNNKSSWLDTNFTFLQFGGHHFFCKYHQQPIGLKPPK